MRAGQLRNTLRIERKVQMGVTAANEPITVWQLWRAPYCGLEVKRGKEQFDTKSLQRYSEEVYLFTVRYDEIVGIDASMRIVFEGANYDIKAVLPDKQRKREAVIECTLQDSVLAGSALLLQFRQNFPPAQVGQALPSFSLEATGGTGPYAFTKPSGIMPPGLALNASTGAITGTPTTPGTYSGIVFQVADAAGDVSALPAFNIVVAA